MRLCLRPFAASGFVLASCLAILHSSIVFVGAQDVDLQDTQQQQQHYQHRGAQQTVQQLGDTQVNSEGDDKTIYSATWSHGKRKHRHSGHHHKHHKHHHPHRHTHHKHGHGHGHGHHRHRHGHSRHKHGHGHHPKPRPNQVKRVDCTEVVLFCDNIPLETVLCRAPAGPVPIPIFPPTIVYDSMKSIQRVEGDEQGGPISGGDSGIGTGAPPGGDNGISIGISPPTSGDSGSEPEVPRRKCNIVGKRVINVPGPCVNNPLGCLAAESDPLAVNQQGEDDGEVEDDGEDEDEDEDEDKVDGKDDGQERKVDGGDFVILSNHRKGGSHKHKKHHSRHKPKKGGSKWAGKCVAKGSFCGNNLFGCGFDSRTVYLCDGVGAAPRPFMHCGSSVCNSGLVYGVDVCKTPMTVPPIVPPTTETLPPTGGSTDTGVNTGVPIKTPTSDPGSTSASTKSTSSDPGTPATTPATKTTPPTLVPQPATASTTTTTTATNTINPTTRDPIPPKTTSSSSSLPATTSTTTTTTTTIPLTEVPKTTTLPPTITGKPAGGSTSETCKCPGKSFYCGAQLLEFDPSCGTSENYVYDCTAGSGTKPVPADLCEPGIQACRPDVIKGAGCKVLDTSGCSCPHQGIYCTEELDPELCKDVISKSDERSIYVCYYTGSSFIPYGQCSEGSACYPMSADKLSAQTSFNIRCRGNTTTGGTPANCDCSNTGHICGATFDKRCDLSAVSLYDCENKGSKPKLYEHCQEGCEEGSDVCTLGGNVTEKCKCLGTDTYCGNELDPICKADKDYIYDCMAGPGSKPKQIAYCQSGKEECLRRKTGEPFCPPGEDYCVPPETKPQCSDLFEGTCHCRLPGIYCANELDADDCRELIDENGPRAIYSCGDLPGAKYELVEKCPKDSVCHRKPIAIESIRSSEPLAAPGIECVEASTEPGVGWNANCYCKNTDNVCGSSFDKACGFNENILYKCKKEEAMPAQLEICLEGCEKGPEGKDVCKTDDPVAETCRCHGAGHYCASDLDPKECSELIEKNGPRAVYSCGDTPGAPELTDTCPSDSICRTVPVDSASSHAQESTRREIECVRNPAGGSVAACKCRNAGLVCGSGFPIECKLNNATLYSCDAVGATPEDKEDCKSGCNPDTAACVRGTTTDTIEPSTSTRTSDGSVTDTPTRTPTATIEQPGTTAPPGSTAAPPTTTTPSGTTPPVTTETPVTVTPQPGTTTPSPPGTTTTTTTTPPPPGTTTMTTTLTSGTTTIPPPGTTTTPPPGTTTTTTTLPLGTTTTTLPPGTTTTTTTLPPGTTTTTLPPGTTTTPLPGTTTTPLPGSTTTTTTTTTTTATTTATTTTTTTTSPTPTPDCTCQDTNNICGNQFDIECKIKGSQLFKCSAAKAAPEPLEDCVLGCNSTATPNNKCNIECKCMSNTDVCGSTFDVSCGLDAGSLYGCQAISAEPEVKEKCHTGCDPAAKPAHKCKPDPTCRCTGNATLCGSRFKAPCDLQVTRLYTCAGAGAEPEPGDYCQKQCLDTQPDNTCEALTFAESCNVAVTSLQKTVMGVVDQAKAIVGSLPAFVGDYLKPIIADLEGYVNLGFTSIDEVAKYAAVLSSALATLSKIVRKNADALAELTGVPALLLTVGVSALDLAVEPAQEVANCKGVPKNCLGIMVVLGHIIQQVVPGLRDSLPFAVKLIAGGYITELENYGERLIQGGMNGDKSSAKGLKDYISGILGTVSTFLPSSVANTINVPVGILYDILDSVDSC